MASSSKYFEGVRTTKVGTLSKTPGYIKYKSCNSSRGQRVASASRIDLCASDHTTTELSKSKDIHFY